MKDRKRSAARAAWVAVILVGDAVAMARLGQLVAWPFAALGVLLINAVLLGPGIVSIVRSKRP